MAIIFNNILLPIWQAQIYIRWSFGVASVGGMFQKKINKLFSGMPNVFSVADDILIAGINKQGKDHGETLDKVLRVCRKAKLKLEKYDCFFFFRCTSIPFFDQIISRKGITLDPRKVQALIDMLSPKSKKELQSFLGILNYLSKFSTVTAEV